MTTKTDTFSLGNVHAISTTADVSSPYDAAPSTDGHTIYFTASGTQGAAVYKAAASGGRAAILFAGSPLVFPSAVAVASDDKALFVSDPAAEQASGALGGIYAIALPSGTPTLVAGSDGFVAAGLAVAGNKLYVAGTSPSGVAGLYAADSAGGALMPVATGSAFSDPSGIAVRSPNEIYVADGGNGAARIVRIAGGKASVILSDLAVGYPAGIALSPDESSLYISALDPNAGGDAVLRLDLASNHVDSTNAGINQFVDAAGLHRATNAPVYAWADTTANGTGTVLVFGDTE
jgi:DNA-binding beta-propeller fold protein YncE